MFPAVEKKSNYSCLRGSVEGGAYDERAEVLLLSIFLVKLGSASVENSYKLARNHCKPKGIIK